MPIQEGVPQTFQTPESRSEYIADLQKLVKEKEVMEALLESPGWEIMREFMVSRIRDMKNRIFKRESTIDDLQVAKGEVYVLKRVLDKPAIIINKGKEAQQALSQVVESNS